MNLHRPKLHPITAVLRFGARGAVGGLLPGLALANPTGGVVVTGQVGIGSQGHQTTVTQTSQSAIVNWQTFSVGSNEYVVFNQPNASSAILNRVVGGTPSDILGSISANGRVFIINPRGVMFGQNSRVDVGSLVATTMDISNADFEAGRYHFVNGSTDGKIENAGVITASNGGFAVLAADQVSNRGLIEAQLGDIALASGSALTLNLDNEGLVNFSIDAAALSDTAGVSNLGTLAANGGRVYMSADVARQLLDTVVNNAGRVSAQSIEENDGEIVLSASGGDLVQAGTLDASAGAGTGGAIHVSSDHDIALASGSLTQANSASGSGGSISVVGDGNVNVIDGAKIDASGVQGGFVELSGHDNLSIRGNLDLGHGGSLLIDPTTVTIAQGSGQSGDDATVYETFIESQLQSGADVTIAAAESIHLADLSANGGDGILDGRSAIAGYGGSLSLAIGTVEAGEGSLFVNRGNGVQGGGIVFDNLADAIAVDGDLNITGGYQFGALDLGALRGANIDLNSAEDISIAGAIHADAPDGQIYIESTDGDVSTHLLGASQIGVYADNGDVTALGDIIVSTGSGSVTLDAGNDLTVSGSAINAGSEQSYGGEPSYGSISLLARDGSITIGNSTLDGSTQVSLHPEGSSTGTVSISDSTVNNGPLSIITGGSGAITLDGVTVSNYSLYVSANDGGTISVDNSSAYDVYLSNYQYLDAAPTDPLGQIRLGSLTATDGNINVYAGSDVVALHPDTDVIRAGGSVSIDAGQTYYYDGNDNSYSVGGDVNLGSVSAAGGIDIDNAGSRYSYGEDTPGTYDVSFANLTSNGGSIYVSADRDIIVRDAASNALTAYGAIGLDAESITIGKATADSIDLAVYGGTLDTGALTAIAGNANQYGDDISIELHDLGDAHGAIGTTGPMRVSGGIGSVTISADSGFSVSGLDIDAGMDGESNRGSINFYSDFGSLEIHNSTLAGNVSALLYGYSTGSCDCYGGYGGDLFAALPITSLVAAADPGVLRIDGVSVDGDIVLHTDNTQAIEIGTLSATGAVLAGTYDYTQPVSISALDVTAASIQLGRAEGYGGSTGGDILIGTMHATNGDVDIVAGRSIAIIDGSSGDISASDGIYLSAGSGLVDNGNGYEAAGGDLVVGALSSHEVGINVYGGALTTASIDLAGGGYYDAYLSLFDANGNTAHIASVGPITIANHAGNIRIESSGDLDIANIGHLDAGSSDNGYGGAILGTVSIGTETGAIQVDSLDVAGNLQLAGTTLGAHTAGAGVSLTASGDLTVYSNVAASEFSADAGHSVGIYGDIDAGSSGTVALRAHDGDLYRDGTLNTANLELQADSLSLEAITLSGMLRLTTNSGAISLSSADASAIILHAASDIDSGDLDAGSAGSITLVADTGSVTTGALTTRNLSVSATSLDFGDLDLSGNLLLTATGGDLSVDNIHAASVGLSAADALNVGGNIVSNGTTSLSGATLALTDQISGSSIAINGGALTGVLDLNAGNGGIALNNSGSTVSSATLTSAGSVDITGPLAASGAISIDGSTIALANKISGNGISVDGGMLSGKLDLHAGSGGIALNNTGSNVTTAQLASDGQISIAAALTASGNVVMNAGDSADFANITAHNITIDAGSASALTQASVLTATAGNVHLGGPSFSGSSLTIASASFDLGSDLYVDNLNIDVSGSDGLALNNVLLSGGVVDLGATHGITLDDLTIDAAQVTLTAGDALSASSTVISGNISATAGGHAQISNATWQGGAASLHAASLDVSDSRFAYSQSAEFVGSDGALTIHDSIFSPTSQGPQELTTETATSGDGDGDITLRSATDITLAGTDISGGRLTLDAGGSVVDDGSASDLDVASMRADASDAIDFAQSTITIGGGDSGVAGDSGLLQLLGEKAPELLPTSTAPNGYLRAQSIALGTLAMNGDYLSLNANTLDIGSVSAAATRLLVQIQPLAATTGTELDNPTAIDTRARSTSPSLLSFNDAAAFAPYDVSLAFGGSGYAGDINVDPSIDLESASTNFLFMTSGHVNGQRSLATNGQVIVLSGIVATERNDTFELPLISEIQPASLRDPPPLDDNAATQTGDDGSQVTVDNIPDGTQCQ